MLNLIFPSFPQLQTERLVLRQLKTDDAELIHQLRSDPEINRYLDRPNSESIDDALAYIEKIDGFVQSHQSFYWVITLKSDDRLMGTICLWNIDTELECVEIGYELMTNHQGKGIMAQAAAAVIDFAFNQIKAKVITAYPSADNQRSVTLLEKLNFRIDESEYSTEHEVDNMMRYILTQ